MTHAHHMTAHMPIPTHRCMGADAQYTELLTSAPGPRWDGAGAGGRFRGGTEADVRCDWPNGVRT